MNFNKTVDNVTEILNNFSRRLKIIFRRTFSRTLIKLRENLTSNFEERMEKL